MKDNDNTLIIATGVALLGIFYFVSKGSTTGGTSLVATSLTPAQIAAQAAAVSAAAKQVAATSVNQSNVGNYINAGTSLATDITSIITNAQDDSMSGIRGRGRSYECWD